MNATKPKSSRKNPSKVHSTKQKQLLDQFANKDVSWIAPLAKSVGQEADVIARYFAELLAKLVTTSAELPSLSNTRWSLAKNLVRMIFPPADGLLSQMEKSLHTFEVTLSEISADLLRDPDITSELIAPAIEMLSAAIEANPRMAFLLAHPDLIHEAFGELGDRVSAVLAIIPALSEKAAASLPELKELCFSALFELTESDRAKLYHLAEEILGHVFREQIFPKLQAILSTDARGKVLAPILLGAVKAIPGESCLNAVLSIACTSKNQITTGRIVAVAIQELGGLYVKISQVIAELSPPSLARELRTSQDNAGGLFPSIEKSWDYLLAALEGESLNAWRPYLSIPTTPQTHFASASMGALYELKLTASGQEKFGTESILVKVQRPGLASLFKGQCDHILSLCTDAKEIVEKDLSLNAESRGELLGIESAIRRAVWNYYRQSSAELDFTWEEKNALRVREALGANHPIRIPRFYMSLPSLVLTERMKGIKVTKIVQTKYLARREIADTIVKAYLDLVFEQGIVWADPHPGNILYDDVTNQVSMIDLNPCFVWDRKTREEFKHLLYRLLLRDAAGVYSTLYELIDNPDSLHSNKVVDDLEKFLNAPVGAGSLIRFVGEFIKTLNENNIDLRIEVQAALRGLSQIALTANAISVRNSFGFLLRRHFGLKDVLRAAWQIGLVRTVRVLTGILFDITRQLPEEDVGPVLDERDLTGLTRRVMELRRASVCDVHISRVSPEDHPTLRMSADDSYIVITSILRIEILEKRRPATVRYVIEIPTRGWLRERQEFVKLASVARNFCIVECLEQLRRSSLDDYWRTVEAWSKHANSRTVEETRLVGEVKSAARRLCALRFENIWNSPFSGMGGNGKRLWKSLMLIEAWREETEHKYISSFNRKFGNVLLTNLAFGTFYRLKMLFIEGILWAVRTSIKKHRYSMRLLPMATQTLEDLILFGLSRSFNSHSQNRS